MRKKINSDEVPPFAELLILEDHTAATNDETPVVLNTNKKGIIHFNFQKTRFNTFIIYIQLTTVL